MTAARRIIIDARESRGLLDGRVSLLLRPVKEYVAPQMPAEINRAIPRDLTVRRDNTRFAYRSTCPFGVPGDVLWGAEAWHTSPHFSCLYRADYEADTRLNKVSAHGGWRRASTMPRWASRHALTLASVRVVRVANLSEEEIVQMGTNVPRCPKCAYTRWDAQSLMDHRICGTEMPLSGVPAMQAQWTARYGRRYPWDTAWAWVLGVAQVAGDMARGEGGA